MKGVLAALNRRLKQKVPTIKSPQVEWEPYPTGHLVVKGELNQDYLWDVCNEESEICPRSG